MKIVPHFDAWRHRVYRGGYYDTLNFPLHRKPLPVSETGDRSGAAAYDARIRLGCRILLVLGVNQ